MCFQSENVVLILSLERSVTLRKIRKFSEGQNVIGSLNVRSTLKSIVLGLKICRCLDDTGHAEDKREPGVLHNRLNM